MTLRELSETSNVALASLSRIETGKMIGTIESHQSIASALGKNLSQLYSNTDIEENTVEYQSIRIVLIDFFIMIKHLAIC